MKNMLKKVSYIIIALVITLGFSLKVEAAETRYGATYGTITATGNAELHNYVAGVSTTVSKGFSRSNLSNYNLLIRQYSGSGDVNDGNNYSWTSYASLYSHYDRYGLAMYCLDSDATGGFDTVFAKRFLLSDPEPGVKAFDMAILSALVNGERNDHTSDDYLATSIAVRSIVATWGYDKNGWSLLYETYFGQAYNWITGDSGIRASYDALSQYTLDLSVLEDYSLYSFQPVWYSSTNTNDERAEAILNKAKQLYAQALADAAEYMDNDGGASIDDNVLTEQVAINNESTAIGDSVNLQIKRTLTLRNFTNDGNASFVINDLTYDQSLDVLGVNEQPRIVEITVNGISYTDAYDFNYGDNILRVLDSIPDEITVEIVIEFTGYENVNAGYQNTYNKLNCGQQPMSYTMSYTYSDTSANGKYSNYVGIVWDNIYADAWGTQYQRFLSVDEVSEAVSQDVTGELTGSVSLIDVCDCDDLIEACTIEAEETGNLEGDACQELLDANCGECAELEIECNVLGDDEACQAYYENCSVGCTTSVTAFECCDAENNLIISTVDNHPVSITGPEEAKICFVNQIDGYRDATTGYENAAGVSDDEENSYTLQKNKYCVVSCKEDYIMNMPTAKLVNAGRYFTFSAAVSGTKTCYTNTIDRELYEADIEQAQRALVDAYNTYARLRALDSASFTNVSSRSCSYSTGCYSEEICTEDDENNNATSSGSSCTRVCRSSGRRSCSWSTAQKTFSYVTYSYSGVASTHNETLSFGSGSCSSCNCSGYSGSCSSVSYTQDYNNRYGGDLSTARSALQTAIDNYNQIISDYNGCSNWTTDINYDPTIYYDYAEDYLADHYNNHGEMDDTITSDNTTEWYCNGSLANGNYTYGTINNGYDSCSGSTDESTALIDYVYCDESGCSFKREEISNASYKKVTSTINVNYVPSTLFYNVYPSGEIVDRDEGENNENATALENKLPVSLSTRRGIYEYTVNITNLGEYYDRNGSLGRLIGGDTAVINEEDYAEFVDENGTVQYMCAYLVNMGIEENYTIVCDWDSCNGDDCTANCVGPNCNYDCDGSDCVADCIGAGCIYDNQAGSSLIERVVSLTNLFPNGTKSYNWNRDVNAKAQTTIEQIQNAGDSIYAEDPILSVTITPSTARAIREYNDEAEKNNRGGYSNATLSCYTIGDYDEIACYSNFISDLIDGTITYNNQVFINNSEIVNNRSLIMNRNYRTESNNNTEYFELWTSGISEQNMIGPSWK